MNTTRTSLRRLAAAVGATLLLLVVPATAAGADDDVKKRDDNVALAVNTEDGASLLRLAFSIRRVTDGVVDQTNQAVALASCTECQTVAIAFQVVLVSGDADVVVPENRAIAYNEQCVECVTYASATQIVIGVDGPTRLTKDGRQRLAELYASLSGLEDELADMTPAQLDAHVQAAKVELVAILSEELETVGRDNDDDEREDDDDRSTTTSSSTSTTIRSSTTSTTTSTPTSTTTTPTSTTTSTTSTTVAG